MAASTGEEMLKKNVWAVVGNHGRNPVVEKLCDRLRSHGKTVFRVNPYGKPPAEYKSLTEIGAAVECVNLVGETMAVKLSTYDITVPSRRARDGSASILSSRA